MKRLMYLLSIKFIVWCFLFPWTPCFALETLQVKTPNLPADISYQVLDNNMVVVSVTDEQGNPITGLGVEDFVVQSKDNTATLLSVESLETSAKVGLNLFLVLDNSASMKHRNAVDSLLSAMEKLLAVLRPIDTVHVVMFDARGGYEIADEFLNIQRIESSDVSELRRFIRAGYQDLSDKTYLYEAMFGAVNMAAGLPPGANKLMVVFSDGEDINSDFKQDVVKTAADKVENLKIYAIDFMPTAEEALFLKTLSESRGGSLWKATASDELVLIFDKFANTLSHQYVISYRFQPLAAVTVEPAAMTIEEVTTIDTSPLLTYIYFDTGESQIPSRYNIFRNQEAIREFDASRLRTTMDKYLNVLNIIGKRLHDDPQAELTLVGCNSAVGEEEGRIDLSRARAEAVRFYLQYMWGVDHSRIVVEARHLPEVPTSNQLPEGKAENQRVEIYSKSPNILDTVKSVYADAISDVNVIRVKPEVQAVHDLKKWKVTLQEEQPLDSVSGVGSPEAVYEFSTKDIGLARLMQIDQIYAAIEIVDEQGQQYRAVSPTPVAVNVLKKEQLLSQKLGYKVMEKYALILFDFDSAEIKGDNAAILDTIVARIQALPSPFVRITGHTDSIGSETYNMTLSKRRAKSVYDQLKSAELDPEVSLTYFGVGPHDPLYDNSLPEGRALNRTVTIDLEYEQRQ